MDEIAIFRRRDGLEADKIAVNLNEILAGKARDPLIAPDDVIIVLYEYVQMASATFHRHDRLAEHSDAVLAGKGVFACETTCPGVISRRPEMANPGGTPAIEYVLSPESEEPQLPRLLEDAGQASAPDHGDVPGGVWAWGVYDLSDDAALHGKHDPADRTLKSLPVIGFGEGSDRQ